MFAKREAQRQRELRGFKTISDIDKLREKYVGTIVDEQGKEAANALRRKINSK